MGSPGRLRGFGRCCAALLAWLLGLVALPAIGPELPSTDDQVVAPAPAVNDELPAQRLVVLIAHPPQGPPAGLEAGAASSFSQLPAGALRAPGPIIVCVIAYEYDGIRVHIRGYVGTSDPVNRWDPSGLWWITNDGRQAVAEPDDTLSGLSLIIFGDATKWQELGYSGDPRGLRVGDRVDISQWGVPHKRRYQRLQGRYGDLDTYAEVVLGEYQKLSQDLDNPLPGYEGSIRASLRHIQSLKQGEGRALAYVSVFESITQGQRVPSNIIDEYQEAAGLIGWGNAFMTLDDEVVIPLATLRRMSDTAGPVHQGISPNDIYRRMAGNERRAMALSNSFKVAGAGLSLLGVYYSSQDLRRHAEGGDWLEAGVDVASIAAAGTSLYETALIIGGRAVPHRIAAANPVAALALITNSAAQSAVSDYGDYAHWKPVREQVLEGIDTNLARLTDAWTEIHRLEESGPVIKRFSDFTNAVEVMLNWTQGDSE
ncbi:MAG: hypothetical protein FKY71_14825 [Spiribacter salinus]|uniref:Uncharacterized protein n=1 Tax=Spiribacter salinus TaxID=1335746 RepID=A0A540VNA5_9GAMM|nr:MAG: hypothetical protein FKY71_14825 [Spiribacter salinus]